MNSEARRPDQGAPSRDRVSEVYSGQAMGPVFQRHLRARIHWMCSQARGPRVLDAGCSQGIAALLLGREGLEVVGVDVEPEAIAEAEQALAAEPEAVRSRVRFLVGNLLDPPADLGRFDSILAGELLEHLVQPERLVQRCWELLRDDGLLVVTVPFGLHPHPDHKQTFYLGGLVSTLSPYFVIERLRLLHTAEGADSPAPLIGAVARKQPSPTPVHLPADDRWLTLYDEAAAAADTRYVSQLERATRRAYDLEQRLRAREVELKSGQAQARESARELEAVRAQEQRLQADLEVAREREQGLRSELEAARAHEERVRSELEAARGEQQRLRALLEATQARVQQQGDQLSAARAREEELRVKLRTAAQREQELRAAGREQDRALTHLRRRLAMMEGATSYRLGLLIVRSLQRPYLLPLLPFRMVAMLGRAAGAKLRRRGRRPEPPPVPRPPAPAPPRPREEAGARAVASRAEPRPSLPAVEEETDTDRLLVAGRYEDPRRTRDLRVAVIMDEFSLACFGPECHLITIRPDNWRPVLRRERPHFLLVESAWKGNGGSWEYRVARYDYPGREELERLVEWCRDQGVPTAFWNKEDPVHFERFLPSARLFDFVFTSDANCIPRYREALGHERVYALPFAAQPRLHNPIRVPGYREKAVCFAGSYYRNRHPERRAEMDWLLAAGLEFGLEIYDRTFGAADQGAGDLGFPPQFASAVVGGVPYGEIARVYKGYRAFLNVNSVADSPTMFSRRVFELLACGTPVVSTPARGIDELLGREVVQVVSSPEEARAALARLLEDERWREQLGLAGQRLVAARHTYAHRLHGIASRLGLPVEPPGGPRIGAVLWADGTSDPAPTAARLAAAGDLDIEFVVAAPPGEVGAIRDQVERAAQGRPVVVLAASDPAAGAWWQDALRASSAEYLALFAPGDHYGPHYLTDLARALGYAGADVVGKACFFSAEAGGAPRLVREGPEYSYTARLLPSATLARRDLLLQLGWPGERLHDPGLLESWAAAGARFFSADRFNYVRGGGDRAEWDSDV